MIDDHTGKIVAVVVCLFLGLIGYGIYEESQAEKFYLRKDSWICTQAHTETSFILINNMATPVSSNICDNWSRK